jgi:hypothetical protein
MRQMLSGIREKETKKKPEGIGRSADYADYD